MAVYTQVSAEALGAFLAKFDHGELVSASDDKTIRVWNLETGEQNYMITGFEDYIYGLACKKNGHIIAGCRDGQLKVWNPDTQDWVFPPIQAHDKHIY